MNHYPRHIGDFAAATQGLSLEERGAYNALLDQYYVHEKPLPLQMREVYRMAVASTPSERASVDYVIRRYFVETPDGFRNKRADEEIARYRGKCDKARESINARWHNERNTDVSDVPIRTYNEANTNQNQNQRTTKSMSDVPPDFGEFWLLYPRKDKKRDALAAWKRLCPDGPLQERIRADVRTRAGGVDWQKEGGQYIPLPASYLNGRRWEDQGVVVPEQPKRVAM